MKKHEASQHTKIEAWIRYFLKTHLACKVELKHTRGKDVFYMREIAEHQHDDLRSFQEGESFVHKFDDVGLRKKPSDFIGVKGGYSFVAIKYNDCIVIISYDVLIKRVKTPSLSKEKALLLSFDIIK